MPIDLDTMTPDARRRHAEKSHDGKKTYCTQAAADNGAHEFYLRTGRRFEGYRCVHCPFYHIGSVREKGQGQTP